MRKEIMWPEVSDGTPRQTVTSIVMLALLITAGVEGAVIVSDHAALEDARAALYRASAARSHDLFDYASRGDGHLTTRSDVYPASMTCGSGQATTWTGSAWECAYPAPACSAGKTLAWDGMRWTCERVVTGIGARAITFDPTSTVDITKGAGSITLNGVGTISSPLGLTITSSH